MNTWRENRFWKWFLEKRFVSLLIALVLLLVAAPVVRMLKPGASSIAGAIILTVIFDIMLLSSLFAISHSKRSVKIALVPMVGAFVFGLLDKWMPNPTLQLLGLSCSILLLGYVVVMIIIALFEAKKITTDTICASICAYLLIGVCWALLYSVLSILVPSAFHMGDQLTESVQMGISSRLMSLTIYYSFVTLSTLGYGDITPVHPVARVLSTTEALFGQIFLTVLVARLVGLQIGQMMRYEKKKADDRETGNATWRD
jgi:hypothetical protein